MLYTTKEFNKLIIIIITSVLNEFLRDFPHMGALKKEQKTCLVNLAHGKDVFVILPTVFGIA